MSSKPIFYKCSRCNGSGRLSQFSNVIGGTCFKCHGSGKQASKPAVKSIVWAVLGTDRNTGLRVHAYNIRAQNDAMAVAKTRIAYERASTAFKNTISLSDAIAVPAIEFWAETYGTEANHA